MGHIKILRPSPTYDQWLTVPQDVGTRSRSGQISAGQICGSCDYSVKFSKLKKLSQRKGLIYDKFPVHSRCGLRRDPTAMLRVRARNSSSHTNHTDQGSRSSLRLEARITKQWYPNNTCLYIDFHDPMALARTHCVLSTPIAIG